MFIMQILFSQNIFTADHDDEEDGGDNYHFGYLRVARKKKYIEKNNSFPEENCL